jgi:two-component system sensor histidine kinase/response regulator
LLSNSIKFTFSGSVVVSVAVESLDDGDFLKIEVEDTGLGIKEEDLPDLFNLFGMLECHADMNRGGSGLGLSIAKSLAEHLGGQMTVTSEYGKGSKFTFYIKDETERQGAAVKINFETVHQSNKFSNIESKQISSFSTKLEQGKKTKDVKDGMTLKDYF